MIRMTVLYPKTDDLSFDMDYYLSRHIAAVNEKLRDMGLVKVQVDEGIGNAAPDQPVPFAVITHLTFRTMEDLQNVLTTHGAEFIGDIPNFTNVQPHIQINRIIVEE
jgi:uncharacterized protein (TIGR02118 family)